ncbi:MAG TPA: hypothetical protein VL334_16690 [Anaerolineae bacterium]|nr:hypothetical protein [Anaerolineae bacterium]
MLVSWETVSEFNNAGFNLYRGLRDDGSDRALLANVPSQAPGSSQGASYSYLDTAVEPGQTTWYWLEDVDLAGATTLHGPVSATVQAPTAVELSRLEAAGSRETLRPWLLAALVVLLGAGWATKRRLRLPGDR